MDLALARAIEKRSLTIGTTHPDKGVMRAAHPLGTWPERFTLTGDQ